MYHIHVYIYIYIYINSNSDVLRTSTYLHICLYVLLYVKRDSDRGRERNLMGLPEPRKTQLLNNTLYTYIVLGPEQN